MATILRTNELRTLPLRALVAIAARMARRVQYAFRPNPAFPLTDQRADVSALDAAIAAAEEAAAGCLTLSPAEREMLVFCVEIAGATTGGDTMQEAIRIDGAVRAAIFAMKTADAALIGDRQRAIESADMALNAGRRVLEQADNYYRRDFERLKEICGPTFNELGDAIDATENGPLGPL